MIKLKPFQSFTAVLAAGVLIGATADHALNSLEMRALSAKQADRKVRSDLLSILRPIGPIVRGNRRQVGDVWMHTKAAATQYQTLCQRDTLVMFYAPSDRGGETEEWPLRPYQLEAARSYRFIGPPKPEHITAIERDNYYRSPFAAECRKADQGPPDNEWLGWFDADSAELAMAGGFALQVVQEWAKVAGNEFSSCTKQYQYRCKEKILPALTLEQLEGVRKCAAGKPGELCLELGSYTYTLTIKARDTHAPMTAADIISVSYEKQIIVT